ncbi:MAG: bifunctional phosphoribosylaminoimidazolecarboxamide formyltransferase/IMP cyclohydrolase [Candidatus Omnitrophica bacterium]|nr:bifunctional phosphoribosylaminoimidazolecarboxamide formyltransferase/IMP cyclohydrolase [Candidatus Omnitrophota bacterium]
MKTKKLALISVSDKTNLAAFAKGIAKLGFDIISTGGTLKFLQDNKIPARSISELTGFPEILDGRVKTLHPKVHGGLLFRRHDAGHKKQAKEHGIDPIDLVVVNLYPFAEVIAKPNVKFEEAIENIDIGGPSMLRSAAKNFESVAVVTDPKDYDRVLAEMSKGGISLETKRDLAQKVFELTTRYDAMIAGFLGRGASSAQGAAVQGAGLPASINLAFEKLADLRYGENPHQKAAVYKHKSAKGTGFPEQLHGKELSFNNLLDAEAATSVILEFIEPAACVVKHNNPCGIAEATTIAQAVSDAIDSDPLSAFGGIVALNRKCDLATAKVLAEKLKFFEVILAPEYDTKALELLKQRLNLRIMKVDLSGAVNPISYRVGNWGLLAQETDMPLSGREKKILSSLKWVTKAKGSKADEAGLVFAWKCAKLVRSNAIVLVQGTQTVGIGAGQMSRVDSVRIACEKSGQKAWGSILASDAFFPMPDNIELAREHGIRLIIQPGGSIKDNEVIAACDKAGIAMCFTGERHFRH